MKAYIYSTLIPRSESTFMVSANPPGLSGRPTAITFVSETVNPASFNAFSATSGLSTTSRSMPKSVVSAMERARISTPERAMIEVISASLPDLFSTKTESCLIYIIGSLSFIFFGYR